MADPTTYRPAPGAIPTDPGVYKFRDDNDRVIYVGKAKNLRARLSNYFQDITQLHPRTRQMVLTAARVEWTVVASEVEALQLEYTWIKRFDPRFNVMYRDDKTYPMLAVSVGEVIPRAFFYRGPRRKGVRYFGPYSHAWAVRETLDLLTRVFPMRTCAKGVYNRHHTLGRPCLLGYIGKCDAPCIGRVSPAEHRETVNQLLSFMNGNTAPVTRELEAKMQQAAEDLEFERAARLRDDLGAIDKIMEQQAVVLSDGTDADLIAFATDELEAAVQIFHVREGRIRGQRGWVVEKMGDNAGGEALEEGQADPALPELLQDFLVQFYTDAVERQAQEADEDAKFAAPPASQRRGVDQESHAPHRKQPVIPREILVQTMPADADEVVEVIEARRHPGRAARPAARRQAGPYGDRPQKRCGAAAPAQAQAGRRSHGALGRPAGHPGGAGNGDGAVAHRVHGYLAHPGHRRGGLPGGLRRWPAAQVGLPALPHQGGCRRWPLR